MHEHAAALDVAQELVAEARARGMLRRLLGDAIDRAAPDAFPFLAPRCNRVVARVMAEIAGLRPGAA